ncbi:hypothetical protein SLA2020_521550 [Shorea laevis]
MLAKLLHYVSKFQLESPKCGCNKRPTERPTRLNFFNEVGHMANQHEDPHLISLSQPVGPTVSSSKHYETNKLHMGLGSTWDWESSIAWVNILVKGFKS